MSHRRTPTEAQRDERVVLDDNGLDWTLEEAARVLLAVKPSDLATNDDGKADK